MSDHSDSSQKEVPSPLEAQQASTDHLELHDGSVPFAIPPAIQRLLKWGEKKMSVTQRDA